MKNLPRKLLITTALLLAAASARAEQPRDDLNLTLTDRHIALNLAACHEMYRIGFAPLLIHAPQLDGKIETAFAHAIELAHGSEHTLYDSVGDPERRAALDRLLGQADELRRLVGGELPRAIDLPIGFNSLDGD